MRLGTRVVALEPDASGGGRVLLADGGHLSADAVVSALPAGALGRLLPASCGAAAAALAAWPTASVAVVSAGFDGAVLPTSGFGYLVPSSEARCCRRRCRRRIAAAVAAVAAAARCRRSRRCRRRRRRRSSSSNSSSSGASDAHAARAGRAGARHDVGQLRVPRAAHAAPRRDARRDTDWCAHARRSGTFRVVHVYVWLFVLCIRVGACARCFLEAAFIRVGRTWLCPACVPVCLCVFCLHLCPCLSVCGS